jgi:hypothetical protein
MTQNIARSTAKISLPVALLIVALGCDGRSPSAPGPATGPVTPTPIRYNLSGMVTDEVGSPVADAQLALYYDNTFKTAKTSTDARGNYSITFESSFSTFEGNPGVVGAIYYTGGGDFENYYVQAVPSGTADVVTNLRLRRLRTLNAGESIIISIDGDSSLAYDGEDFLRMDWMSERLHVRVAEAGKLTVDVRPPSGDMVPQLSIFCRLVIDNCYSEPAERPTVPWRQSRYVNGNSLFEIRVAIPSAMAPQQYEVVTSRQ